MRLYIYYCSQAFKGNWFWSVYQNNDFPPDDGEGTFDNGIRTLGMKFSLVDVSNAEGVRTCVEEFKSKLKDFFPDIVKW